MKALVLTTCYPTRTRPNHGIFIHRQMQALVDLGVECHVLQPIDWAPPGPLARLRRGWKASAADRRNAFEEIDGIPVHHPRVFLPVPSRFFPGDYWERVGRAVARYVSSRPDLRSADVMYAHFLCTEGFAGLVARRRLGIPLVAIARGDDVHAWPERRPDRVPKLEAVLSSADGLLACSRGLARDAEQWATSGLSTPIDVVYNGIDLDRFAPVTSDAERRAARLSFGLPSEGRVLLCVARASALKGWRELLDAFAATRPASGDWHLVMVGGAGGGDDLDLTVEAERRGLSQHATLLPTVSPGRMPELYRSADLFALASYDEGLSNAVLEALACGVACVATRVGGHAELIDDGVSGVLVPPRDTAALTDALASLMSDADELARLGREGRSSAMRIGSHAQNAAHLRAYFDRVVARAARRAVVAEPVPSASVESR